MHKFTSGEFTMHVYGDLSDDIKIEEHGKLIATIPAELIRMYVRKLVLNHLRDNLRDVMYRQLSDMEGLDHPDAAQILDGIDHLRAISTTPNPSNALHGMLHLLGHPVHVTFIRVERVRGFWAAVDPAYSEELQRVKVLGGSDSGHLKAINVPGFSGDYVAYTYPYSE